MIADELEKAVIEEVEYDDEEIENADDDEEPVDIAEYNITSFGIDYDVHGIVRRLRKETILVPDFQRAYVWPIRRASKFIESLLLKLPIPGIFLYREHGSHEQMIIDGHQRLETLRRFHDGLFDRREFALTGVREQFEGLTYRGLTDQQCATLDDSIIHATIIKQDAPNDGGSSKYEIFQRLNANATPLSAQEIRAASFGGEFCDLLVELNENEDWRDLFGKKHRRRRDEELILRFFALYHQSEEYERPMKGFINEFMRSNRNLQVYPGDQLEKLFTDTISVVSEKIGSRAFKPTRAVNASLFESLMIGLARRLEDGPITAEISTAHSSLLSNEDFKTAIGYRTSDVGRVDMRIRLATEAFANVG